MKIRELLNKDVTIDVFDNVCEELGIAFCGPLELTSEGEKYFAEVLDYDIEINKDYVFGGQLGVVDIDGDDWEDRLEKAKEFFESAAGYCGDSDYDRWFKE